MKRPSWGGLETHQCREDADHTSDHRYVCGAYIGTAAYREVPLQAGENARKWAAAGGWALAGAGADALLARLI